MCPSLALRFAAFATAGTLVAGSGGPPQGQERFRFRTSTELINVTATVTDRSGRFVPGLTQSDFAVYDDDQPVQVTHFDADRVPVSLGIVLDTSGSMAGDKMKSARGAIERFLDQLANPDDEVFLYSFSSQPQLVQEWTTNREAVSASLRRLRADGGTAVYDAVLEALPMAQQGRNRKKAIVVISDGNDTSSRADVEDVRRAARGTEVLVYAVGIDGDPERTTISRPPTFPMPFPIPGRGRPLPPWRRPPRRDLQLWSSGGGTDRLNVRALRDITDDSGGRTEVVRSPRDLDPATSSIASELSRQYYLGYPSPGHRDGRWHVIRVEVPRRSVHVRARRGYVAPGAAAF